MTFENFKLDMNMKPKKTAQKITKQDVLEWVERERLSQETKTKLIMDISKYPSNTMGHYFKNIEKHIQKIEQERR